MLHVRGTPGTAPTAQMLKKDVCAAVEEDEEALDKLGRGPPFPRAPLGDDVPGPAPFGEAAAPTAQGEEAEPEEDAALDPMGKAAKDAMALLFSVLESWFSGNFREGFWISTHKETTKGDDAGRQGNEAKGKNDAVDNARAAIQVLPHAPNKHLCGYTSQG